MGIAAFTTDTLYRPKKGTKLTMRNKENYRVGMQVERSCPMCKSHQMKVHFIYHERPPGEFDFASAKDIEYLRMLDRCDICGHYLEYMNADMSNLYHGDYVEKVWGSRDQIRATFEKINALSPEKSDNVGRVAYIRAFAEGTEGPGRLLDVGSGLGVFPFRMKQAGWDCTALDMDPVLAAHIREAVGIPCLEGDITRIRDIGPFDLITFNKVLEHIADPVAILADVKRFLRPGGVVYVELPDGEGAETEGQNREEYLLGHIHVFSFASYALLAHRAGFDVVQCHRIREPSSKFTLRGFLRSAVSAP